jgi:hypothetical protein
MLLKYIKVYNIINYITPTMSTLNQNYSCTKRSLNGSTQVNQALSSRSTNSSFGNDKAPETEHG